MEFPNQNIQCSLITFLVCIYIYKACQSYDPTREVEQISNTNWTYPQVNVVIYKCLNMLNDHMCMSYKYGLAKKVWTGRGGGGGGVYM